MLFFIYINLYFLGLLDKLTFLNLDLVGPHLLPSFAEFRGLNPELKAYNDSPLALNATLSSDYLVFSLVFSATTHVFIL